MKVNKLPTILSAFVILLTILACGGSITTANIGDTWLATDDAGDNRTTVFSQDADFYLFVELNNAPDDTQLKASWVAVDVDGTDANTVVNETDFTSSNDIVQFSLTNEDLWPVGSYKVDVYLNGTLEKTLTFQVQ